MLLEPDKFAEGVSHHVVPAGVKLNTKEGHAWRKDHPDASEPGGLPYIRAETDAANQASLADMKGMMASLMAHQKIRRIIETSVKQESAFCRDPDTGLMRKVRPDARCFDNSERIILADLKSTFRGGATVSAWQQHCARMSYHIQDSFYTDVYTDLMAPPYFIFMVVERKPPYACRLFQIDPTGKKHARDKYKKAMEQFRKCQDTGIWPGYDEDIVTVSLPSWEIRAPDPESINL
jgi:exodeoxyribonuclease VIII